MKNCKIVFILTAFYLSFSCKKVNENAATAEWQTAGNTQSSKNARVAATSCTAPPVIDTAHFSAGNKIDDVPISPDPDAQNNYEKIQWCLLKYKRAVLNSGEFVINNVLIVDQAELTSANGDWPTIKAIATNSNALIKMYNNSRVSFLTLNANKHFLDQENASVVEIGGYSNKVDNNWIKGGDVPLYRTDSGKIAGVYIMCGDNNLVLNNKIRNNFSGCIIKNSLPGLTNNLIDGNDMFYNCSDGITLATYGQVKNNNIYFNGWDCKNGNPPIPGAGIYSEQNHEGALIQDNIIYDNNGHNIDLADVQKFSIIHNTVYNPGNMNFPEAGVSSQDFGGAFSVSLFDASYCTVQDNDIRNEGRSTNSVGNGTWGIDPNKILSESATERFYSDLPFGANSVIAFCMAESRCPEASINQVKQNIIRNNIFIASPNGIGYFASRNTGFEADQSWSTATTNYFTLNNPNGSNIGSVRCGGNWYASQTEANTDDIQHQPPSSDWAGNDYKKFYDLTCAH